MSRFAPDRRQARCGPWPSRLVWSPQKSPGRVVSRLAPDRRPAPWLAQGPSRSGWSPPQCLMRLEEALKRQQKGTEDTTCRGLVRPTASGDKVGPTCTVTRDTQQSLVRQQRAPRTWPSPSTHRVRGAIKDQGDRDEVGEELVQCTVCRTTVHRRTYTTSYRREPIR